MRVLIFFLLVFCIFSLDLSVSVQAQEEESEVSLDDIDLAKAANQAANNPLGGNFFVILNQLNIDFLQGDITNETRNVVTHILQPVVPVPVPFLCEYCIWVNRPTFAFIYSADLPVGIDARFSPGSGDITIPEQPLPGSPIVFDSTGGFGDIIYFTLVGISKPTRWNFLNDDGFLVLAPGITTQWPAGSKEFSSNQYSVGPAAVAAWIGEKYVLGALWQQWWSYAERNRGKPNPKFNQSLIQYFYYINFPGAWAVGAAPQITIDFEADSRDKLQFPIGLGVTKTILIPLGKKIKLPLKLGVEADYYLAKADSYGNEFRIIFTFAPIIPAPWANLPGM